MKWSDLLGRRKSADTVAPVAAFHDIFPFLKYRPPGKAPQPYLEEEPDYFDQRTHPPMRQLIPPLATERLLHRNRELLHRIRRASQRTDEEFDQLYMPIIRRYGDLVHYLPASENHHHESYGGLFRHGIEVGYYCLNWAINNATFDPMATGKRRKQVELIFPFAAFIAGMLHDVGKVMTDLLVASEDGSCDWNVTLGTITDWCHRNGLKGYLVTHQQGRHDKHTVYNTSVADLVCTREITQMVYALDPDFAVDVRAAIQGAPTHTCQLLQAVETGDQWSVSQDMKNPRGRYGSINAKVGADSIYLDAMRALIKAGKWVCNDPSPGHVLWLIDGGLYLRWPIAGQWVKRYLSVQQIPHVPYGEQQIRNILTDRGYFIDPPNARTDRFWYVVPKIISDHTPNAFLKCLRLNDPQVLFDGVVPNSIEGTLQDITKHRGGSFGIIEEEGAAAIDQADMTGVEGPTPSEALPSPGVMGLPEPGTPRSEPPAIRPTEAAQKPRTEAALPPGNLPAGLKPPVGGSLPQDLDDPIAAPSARARGRERAQQTSEMQLIPAAAVAPPPAPPVQDIEATAAWFESHSLIGKALKSFAEDTTLPADDTATSVHDFYWHDGCVAIRYPEGLDIKYGDKAINFLRSLDQLQWLETRSSQVMRKVREDTAFAKALVLSPEISVKLAILVPSMKSRTTPPSEPPPRRAPAVVSPPAVAARASAPEPGIRPAKAQPVRSVEGTTDKATATAVGTTPKAPVDPVQSPPKPPPAAPPAVAAPLDGGAPQAEPVRAPAAATDLASVNKPMSLAHRELLDWILRELTERGENLKVYQRPEGVLLGIAALAAQRQISSSALTKQINEIPGVSIQKIKAFEFVCIPRPMLGLDPVSEDHLPNTSTEDT